MAIFEERGNKEMSKNNAAGIVGIITTKPRVSYGRADMGAESI